MLASADVAGSGRSGRAVFFVLGSGGARSESRDQTHDAGGDGGCTAGTPSERTGQPWTPQDLSGAEAHPGLRGIAIALERYELGVDPGVAVRDWPQIQTDIDRLVRLFHHVVDYAATSELAPALIGELQGAYLRWPQRRREVLLGLIDAHRVAMRIAKDPERLSSTARQAEFYAELGRTLSATKKTRDKGARLLLHAEHLAPQRIHHDLFVRETIADLLRQSHREAGGRELRGLAG